MRRSWSLRSTTAPAIASASTWIVGADTPVSFPFGTRVVIGTSLEIARWRHNNRITCCYSLSDFHGEAGGRQGSGGGLVPATRRRPDQPRWVPDRARGGSTVP